MSLWLSFSAFSGHTGCLESGSFGAILNVMKVDAEHAATETDECPSCKLDLGDLSMHLTNKLRRDRERTIRAQQPRVLRLLFVR